MVERVKDEVWDVLEEVIKEHPVLLNRAPTLHRLGIQAFEPVLVEGRAIKLHPLVCTAYNADFDGDQMAVHVPLSAEAQAEARFLMLSANNLLKPQDGKPVTVPTQDMVLGTYYLTIKNEEYKGKIRVFSSPEEALMAYNQALQDRIYEADANNLSTFGEIEGDRLTLHAPIKIRMSKKIDGKTVQGIIDTTIGRLIFNEAVPQDLGFVDRSNPENLFKLEIDFLVDKNSLQKIIDRCIKVHGTTQTAIVLDRIKALGFKYSTKGAIIAGTDITELKGQQNVLVQQEKLAVLGQMGAGIVHETRNFLSTIKGRCQLIDVLTEDQGIKNHLSKINSNIDELNMMMSEFLFLSKPKQPLFEELSMYDIIHSIKGMIEASSVIKGVTVDFDLSKEERYLLCDEAQIKQVILNMCKNAVEAMSEQSRAKLKVSTGYNKQTNEMFIKISDNGKGISKESLEKIGTPFFTTKKPWKPLASRVSIWLRGIDLNYRPSGYEPDELPDCSTPRCYDVYIITHFINNYNTLLLIKTKSP
jgi:signal transduction histidine kinase